MHTQPIFQTIGLNADESTEVLAWVDDQIPELEQETFEKLFKYYAENGMPYGVAKARTGDPAEWIHERLTEELQEPLLP